MSALEMVEQDELEEATLTRSLTDGQAAAWMIPRALRAPGAPFSHKFAYEMLDLGRRLRDQYQFQFPYMASVVKIFGEMASTREWRFSGKVERNLLRANEALHNFETLCHDGRLDIGFEESSKRMSTDHLCVGRWMFVWDEKGKLRYLDPTETFYDKEERIWWEQYIDAKHPVSNVVTYHPFPIGTSGYFVSPLSFVIPTAQLAYLIGEHDRAALDGRKIRDIMIVNSKKLAEQLNQQVRNQLALWAGEDPTKLNISVIYTEGDQNKSMADVVHMIGLSNMPQTLNRTEFHADYANQLAATSGVTIRRFYTGQENGTNRSLEEVQEMRQVLAGPAAFTRTLQRKLNTSGWLRTFGPGIRQAFVEEVDAQSMKVRAEVLKLTADAFGVFVDKLMGTVDTGELVAWLQSDGILPPELKIIKGRDGAPKIIPSDSISASSTDTIIESDPKPTPSESANEKSAPLGYDEYTINQDGEVIDYRRRIIAFPQITTSILEKETKAKLMTFSSMLDKARARNVEEFLKLKDVQWEEEEKSIVARLVGIDEAGYTDQDYADIKRLLDTHKQTLRAS